MNVCKFLGQKFVHLHLHTEYSPLDAPVSLKKLVEYAKHLGYKSLAVTDHGTVGSWVKFALLCKENDIKPIFGIEAYFVPDRTVKTGKRQNHHLVMLAKNDEGIKNIYRMSEAAFLDGFYYDPRVDWALLEKHSEGVVCTSACVSGIVPETLRSGDRAGAIKHAKRFMDIFGDDFYVELQYHGAGIEDETYGPMSGLAKELGIKTVGTNDCHYLRKEDANIQEVMMALNTGRCIKAQDRLKHCANQYYLKSPDEMLAVLGGAGRASVQSTLEIMDKCTAELKFGKTQFPAVELPKEFASDLEHLESLARQGLRKLGKEGNEAYEARFKEEIEVLRKLRQKGKAFDRYFLVVADYVKWAWDHGVRVGVGRGSGAGSLLLYCLRVTGIDPLKYDLLFERFLAEDRKDSPDIDIDFDAEMAELVIGYAMKKYGADRVARICTQNVFHVASAIKAAFRVFDPCGTFEKEQAASRVAKKVGGGPKRSAKKEKTRDETAQLSNEITKKLPKDPSGNPSGLCTLLKSVYDKNPEERIYVYDAVPEFIDLRRKYPEIFEFAESIEGIISGRGVHAAGVLITEDPLVEVCPQQLSGKGVKRMATVFDMGDIEKLGGVKFDFLNTKVLSVITRTLRAVHERHGGLKDGKGNVVDIDTIEPDDPDVLRLFAKGDALAIFQFESDGMRRVLRDMKPDRFEDLIAANALFRPGPKDFISTYIARKHGVEKVSYAVKALEPVLKPTFGIIVYQEQVMKIVRILAGFSALEAEQVRKAMGKKKKDLLDAMKDKFMKGCQETNTCQPQVAQDLWQQMETFSAYAFNRSHSACYAYTAYQCAFLKTYYPAEFMAAQLTVEGWDAKYETVREYEIGVRQMGIKLLDADINKSKIDYSVEDVGGKPAVRKGFKGVMGLGETTCSDVFSGQPYSDMYDYCMRSGSGAKSDVVKSLIQSRAFDWFLPALSRRLGRSASAKDLEIEYVDKNRKAQAQRRDKGSRKEEKEGIGFAFGMEEQGPPVEQFSLEI
jgi:DNA polymerase-3 subunit alpha